MAETEYAISLDVRYEPLELIDVQRIIDENEEPWLNQTLTQVNDCVVRIGILKGAFIWHKHDDEDEFFYVVQGKLLIDFQEGETMELGEKQGVTVPRGVVHRTRAPEGVVVLMVEGEGVVPTGD